MKPQPEHIILNENTSSSFATNDLLQLVLEHTQELLFILDAQLNILALNKKANDLCTHIFQREILPGESLWDIVEPERKAFLIQIHNDLKAGKTLEYDYVPPYNQAALTFHIKFSASLDKEYNLNKVVLSGRDITNEARILTEANASKSLLQRAESIARIGSWQWDIITDSILFSDEFCRICGVEPGGVIPTKENGFDFIHPAEREMAYKILENTFKTGNPFSVQIRIITASGELKYVHSRGIILRNQEGRNVKFIGTLHDITALKILENSIQQTQLQFQYLIENSADVMLLVNDKRQVIFASPSVHQMMGYEPGEIIGLRLRDLAAPEDLPAMLQHFNKILSSPALPVTLQYRVKTITGKLIWVEGTINNLLHLEGINSIVINQRDISTRKETEKLMQQLNDKLEQQAQELSASNIELEKFAYIASHDLQEPLRMITSFLHLLQKKYRDKLDENAIQYIQYAVDGGERMKNLINALLEYSRLGTKKIKHEQLDMNTEMQKVLQLFNKSIKDTDAIFNIPPLPVIEADKIQIQQLLQNLAGNALKYRGKNSPVININAEQKNGYWIFCIADNGLGIEKKDTTRIFEVFQRLHNRTQYEGTGIGLSIAKKIVEIHGGEIWVEPNNPEGTKFYFTIRMRNSE